MRTFGGFFDTISHKWLMKFVEHRIADRRMLRLLKKWLRAGVSEDGEWSPTKVGTPQGAVISPLYANVFLHYVLDLWINDWRGRHAKGEVILVRYAEERRAKRGAGPPETFDFLGFTHISGKTRRGDFTIHRKTSRKKFQA